MSMALGAQPGDVLRMVLRQGMTPLFAGLFAGTLAAAAMLLAVSAAACWIPARRATRVNPIDALRFD
jgi:ABC-type lipoprotein release transport system permease subunit